MNQIRLQQTAKIMLDDLTLLGEERAISPILEDRRDEEDLLRFYVNSLARISQGMIVTSFVLSTFQIIL